MILVTSHIQNTMAKFQEITGPGIIYKGKFYPSPIRRCARDMLNMVVKLEGVYTIENIQLYFGDQEHIGFTFPKDMTNEQLETNRYYIIVGNVQNHYILWPVDKVLRATNIIRYKMMIHKF